LEHSPRDSSSLPERRAFAQPKTARWLSAIVFYGLIVLLLAIPIPYGSVEPWSQAAFQCAVFALGFLGSIHILLTRQWLPGDLRVFLPLIATAVFAALQSFSWSQSDIAGVKVLNALSADPFESWIFALRLSALALAGILAVRFTNSHLRLRVLAHAIIFVGVASAIFGIMRRTMQHRDGFLLSSLVTGGGFAQFINKNHFAYAVEPALGLLAAMILLQKGAGHRKLLYVSALILLWAALVMSRSRGGLLAASVEMIAAALFFISAKRPSLKSGDVRRRPMRSMNVAAATIILILLVAGATTVWLGGDQLSTGVETAANEISNRAGDAEGARRRDIWRATLKMARAHPIAGAGLGGYWAEIPRYHDANGMLTPQQAHNDYLELLASAGLIGVGLFFWFAWALIRRLRKAQRTFTGVQQVYLVGAVIGIVGIAVHSLVDFGLHITSNALLFVMLLAFVSLNEIDQRAAAQEHRNAAFK
jgi:O-antigen ligase